LFLIEGFSIEQFSLSSGCQQRRQIEEQRLDLGAIEHRRLDEQRTGPTGHERRIGFDDEFDPRRALDFVGLDKTRRGRRIRDILAHENHPLPGSFGRCLADITLTDPGKSREMCEGTDEPREQQSDDG
jgi:hypothetical protein